MSKKRGAPTKFNPNFHIDDFIRQSSSGKTIVQIASEWDVHKDTIYEWVKTHKKFSDAFKLGKQKSEAWWLNLGVSGMLGQAKVNGEKVKVDFPLYKYLTTVMHGWSDNSSSLDDSISEIKLMVKKYEQSDNT